MQPICCSIRTCATAAFAFAPIHGFTARTIVSSPHCATLAVSGAVPPPPASGSSSTSLQAAASSASSEIPTASTVPCRLIVSSSLSPGAAGTAWPGTSARIRGHLPNPN